MLQDKHGNEIKIGDTVAAFFKVSQIIPDSMGADILVAHVAPPPGTPDDLRLALRSADVTRLEQAQTAPAAAENAEPATT